MWRRGCVPSHGLVSGGLASRRASEMLSMDRAVEPLHITFGSSPLHHIEKRARHVCVLILV